jgi:predicted  nucleic acid-binding Zn-ribbon protein
MKVKELKLCIPSFAQDQAQAMADEISSLRGVNADLQSQLLAMKENQQGANTENQLLREELLRLRGELAATVAAVSSSMWI